MDEGCVRDAGGSGTRLSSSPLLRVTDERLAEDQPHSGIPDTRRCRATDEEPASQGPESDVAAAFVSLLFCQRECEWESGCQFDVSPQDASGTSTASGKELRLEKRKKKKPDFWVMKRWDWIRAAHKQLLFSSCTQTQRGRRIECRIVFFYGTAKRR